MKGTNHVPLLPREMEKIKDFFFWTSALVTELLARPTGYSGKISLQVPLLQGETVFANAFIISSH